MQRITISQAKAGMVLAHPAENDQGTVICAAGTPLTDTLIRRLERFGVLRLVVEGHPVPHKAETKSAEELAAELDRRFERHMADPLMAELKSIFRERLRARMADMAGDETAAG